MKILIAGDFVPRERVLEKIKKKDYADIFADLKPYIDQADYSVLNLEAPIVLDSSKAKPIQKVGPALSAPVETIDVIKDAGFNCVTLANNHIMDYGAEALNNTISVLDEKQILHVGAGKSLDDASKVLYMGDGLQTVAIVNFCENEFSIAGDNTSGAYPLSIVKNYRQIREAKENADYVVVIVHGGHEHYQFPSPRMKETYHFFIDAGADAVINHHQHCFSGFESYHDKPIFYGLGNLCFDKVSRRGSIWDNGFFVVLSFEERYAFQVIPYVQCSAIPLIRILDGRQKEEVMNCINEINGIISNDASLKTSFSSYADSRAVEFRLRFSPNGGKVFRFLASKQIIPSKICRKKALQYLNTLNCESHRDIAIALFEKSLESNR